MQRRDFQAFLKVGFMPAVSIRALKIVVLWDGFRKAPLHGEHGAPARLAGGNDRHDIRGAGFALCDDRLSQLV